MIVAYIEEYDKKIRIIARLPDARFNAFAKAIEKYSLKHIANGRIRLWCVSDVCCLKGMYSIIYNNYKNDTDEIMHSYVKVFLRILKKYFRNGYSKQIFIKHE